MIGGQYWVRSGAIVALGAASFIWVGANTVRQFTHGTTRDLVIVGFGGSYGDALRAAVIEPFERASGVHVRYDETCCARIAPAVGAGQFAGDLVAGVDFGGLLNWSQQGVLLPDRRLTELARSRDISPRYTRGGAGSFIIAEYAYVMAAHGDSTVLPLRWSEFWDVKRFPGSRALIRATPAGQLEAALLADGAQPSSLYPLDVDRALASLGRLRSSVPVLFANSPADLVSLLARGDARYAIAFSNRLEAARRDGLPVSFTYSQGIRTGNGFGLLRGARHTSDAIAFLEFASRERVLADFTKRSGLLPVSTDVRAPGTPNALPAIDINAEYWGQRRAALGELWVRWLVQ